MNWLSLFLSMTCILQVTGAQDVTSRVTRTSTLTTTYLATSTTTIPPPSNHTNIATSKEISSTTTKQESSTSATSAKTSTASTPSSTGISTSYTSDSDFESSVLASHNFFREEHNATSLKWNSTSAKYAQTYSAKCLFVHSGGPTGENLAAGFVNATSAVNAWGLERENYNFSNPGFSETTGHFTQIVWKATKTVGCGRHACDGKNGTSGYYVVCEYYPPGNVGGQYATEIDKLMKGNITLGFGMGSDSSSGFKYGWLIGIIVGVAANIVFVVMLIWKLS